LQFEEVPCTISAAFILIVFRRELQRFQGDGETGVTMKARSYGDRAVYRPRQQYIIRDSPDESQTGINVRVFPALLQDRREVLTATSTSGNPNAWSSV
jgi:hypothetical protein